ncbi:MAG: hypothetical protein EA397_12350 [Deltaproteobacteria bacterium]|nr:MAG: hypothetical protein EA397_12350 [Deltaproteobacteria bacterium]
MPLLFVAAVLLIVLSLALGGAAIALAVWFTGTWWRFVRYHRHKGLELPDGPTWGDRIRAWILEGAAILRLMTYKAEWGPRAVPFADDRLPPVFCVHGFTQDRTNFSRIRSVLYGLGRSSIAINLGRPGRAPERYADRLAERFAELLLEVPEGPIDVICHSMGGLLFRQILRDHPELRPRVRTVVTLGSPHHGTAASRGPLRRIPEAKGLHRKSAWVLELPTLAELLPEARTITVAGTADYVVYPKETCHLIGSEAVDLPGVGHAGLLVDPRTLALIREVFQPLAAANLAEPETNA